MEDASDCPDCHEIEQLFQNRSSEGKLLLEKLKDSRYARVRGRDKLERRIAAELKFLSRMKSSGRALKKEHLVSSNLQSISAIVAVLEFSAHPVSVLQVFHFNGNKIEVDVVADGGCRWYKAVARSPDALSRICKGDSSYGKKSIVDQACMYVNAAKENQFQFQTPKVEFYFASGVSRTLASRLTRLGLVTTGVVVDVPQEDETNTSSSESDLEEDEAVTDRERDSDTVFSTSKLFLDITAMVALVSALTNGGANLKYPRDLYNQQAEWERRQPAKAFLDSVMNGKDLFSCASAVKDFKSLVSTIGGPAEKQRADNLLQNINIVPDCMSRRVSKLQITANVKERSRTIFGTADLCKMLILTANTGFVNSAEGQGVKLSVVFHEPRVLTEAQESFAVPLSDETE